MGFSKSTYYYEITKEDVVAKRSEAKGMDVLVVSGDRDLLQIVTDDIRVCIPKTKRGNTEYEKRIGRTGVSKCNSNGKL